MWVIMHTNDMYESDIPHVHKHDNILWEWDYLFSSIKQMSKHEYPVYYFAKWSCCQTDRNC